MDPSKLAERLPTTELRTLAERIFENVARDSALDATLYRDGYRAGFDAGESIGYSRAQAEMDHAWHTVYETVQRHARMRSWIELQTLRYPKDNATEESRYAA